jgi:DNA-binding HxlR family transcriptional regulator
MLGRTYDGEVCSAARALELAGERWSLLILRNAAFAGMTRFNQFQESLRLAPNILAARLEHFVDEGLMSVSPGPRGRPEYRLTDKGLDFKPVIAALSEWGDRWAAPDGAPIVYEHDACRGHIRVRTVCDRCGESVDSRGLVARKTPALELAWERRRAAAAGKARRARRAR